VQDNEAKSKKNVLRGLHYQLPPYDQAKLVRVVTGEVLDVIVDIRPESSTFGKTFSLILNDISKKQLFVPRGFAHGYVVLSEEAIFVYKCDNFYHPVAEGGILYCDKLLNIDWIIDINNAIVSEKDSILPNFGEHLRFE
jgi:dTDP-4-dehydrorhamnose 3,5-epimerase